LVEITDEKNPTFGEMWDIKFTTFKRVENVVLSDHIGEWYRSLND